MNADYHGSIVGAPGLQTCKHCGLVQRFEFAVVDSLWAMLPPDNRDASLCIECFLGLLEDSIPIMHELALSAEHFTFMRVIGRGDKLSGIILDREQSACPELDGNATADGHR